MKAFAHSLLFLFLSASLLFGVAACDNSSTDGPVSIRVVHAASAMDAIDFLVNFDPLARNLTFRQAGPYIQIESGLNLLEVRTEIDGIEVSITREVLLEAGRPYTLLVTGTADASSLILLEDNRSTPPAGQARVTVAHAAEDASTVSFSAFGEASTTPVLDVSRLAFGNATDPVTVDAGSYDLTVTSTDGTRTATLADEPFEVGRRYLVMVSHLGETLALSLFVIADG